MFIKTIVLSTWFLIEFVTLSSEFLRIVIQIMRSYNWPWTPGPAQAHDLGEGVYIWSWAETEMPSEILTVGS